MWVCAEDGAGGFRGGRDGAEVRTTFEGVDAVDVVGVDYAAADETAEELGEEVDWEAPPREFSEEAVC